MKKYKEYILKQQKLNESDEQELSGGTISENIINTLLEFKKYIKIIEEETKKILNMTDDTEKTESSSSTIKNYVDDLISNLQQIKKDGELQKLISKCNQSISLINRELNKLNKIVDPDDEVKNDKLSHKNNLEQLTKLLNEATKLM